MHKMPFRRPFAALFVWSLTILGVVVCLGEIAHAENQSPGSPYSGDVFSRSTLSGDWGGVRNDLAGKGVTLDATLTQVEQGVVHGGKSSDWQYGGRGDLTFKLDTGKLGLWPGGFLAVETEGNFGKGVNRNTGALSPANPNQILPIPDNDEITLPALNFVQFLSHYLGLAIGKMDTVVNGDMNEFAHGKGDFQFLNLALNMNLALMMTVPSSTLGAGMIILPTKDPGGAIVTSGAIVTLSVLSTEGKANTSGFDNLYAHKLTFIGEGRMRTGIFGFTGHQLVGFSHSNKDFASLDQRLGSVLATGQIQSKSDSWAAFYNFDQYLYEPEKGSGRGLGIFGRFGATDGNPNPVHYLWSLGVGGKGAIASRPEDRFGIGYYSMTIRQPDFNLPASSSPLLRNEYGIEAFYSAALTPWLLLTPDIQIVRPSQKEEIKRTGPLSIERKNIETATILGIRLQMVL